MFDRDRFIADCMGAVAEGQGAIAERVAEAVSDGDRVLAQLGAPTHAGINVLYRAPELTIINFVWAPCMSLMPHDHHMYSVVGIYTGREDNLFWRRTPGGLEAYGAKSVGVGDITALERDAIHSVLNPLARMSCAIHVYGGDFFAPPEPRSMWDHETLAEEPWEVEKVKAVFGAAEARFNAWQGATAAAGS